MERGLRFSGAEGFEDGAAFEVVNVGFVHPTILDLDGAEFTGNIGRDDFSLDGVQANHGAEQGIEHGNSVGARIARA